MVIQQWIGPDIDTTALYIAFDGITHSRADLTTPREIIQPSQTMPLPNVTRGSLAQLGTHESPSSSSSPTSPASQCWGTPVGDEEILAGYTDDANYNGTEIHDAETTLGDGDSGKGSIGNEASDTVPHSASDLEESAVPNDQTAPNDPHTPESTDASPTASELCSTSAQHKATDIEEAVEALGDGAAGNSMNLQTKAPANSTTNAPTHSTIGDNITARLPEQCQGSTPFEQGFPHIVHSYQQLPLNFHQRIQLPPGAMLLPPPPTPAASSDIGDQARVDQLVAIVQSQQEHIAALQGELTDLNTQIKDQAKCYAVSVKTMEAFNDHDEHLLSMVAKCVTVGKECKKQTQDTHDTVTVTDIADDVRGAHEAIINGLQDALVDPGPFVQFMGERIGKNSDDIRSLSTMSASNHLQTQQLHETLRKEMSAMQKEYSIERQKLMASHNVLAMLFHQTIKQVGVSLEEVLHRGISAPPPANHPDSNPFQTISTLFETSGKNLSEALRDFDPVIADAAATGNDNTTLPATPTLLATHPQVTPPEKPELCTPTMMMRTANPLLIYPSPPRRKCNHRGQRCIFPTPAETVRIWNQPQHTTMAHPRKGGTLTCHQRMTHLTERDTD